MTDRELLELAAKAAGIPVEFWHGYGFMRPVPFKGFTNYEPWNPLTDDGDALRLAVKLRIRVDFQGSTEATNRVCAGDVREWCKFYDGDMAQATRRAIVRAAAEIGKAMP